MSESYAREILRRNVAQICQTIGWNGINSTPLDILVHILEKYIRTLGTEVNNYAEQFNRTEPNLNDLGLVFRDLHVQLPELLDYTRSVPPIPAPVETKFPKPKESNLNFLKPGSHEVVTRPMHVHEHLPPMYPEKERETPLVADTVEIRQNGIDTVGTSNVPSCSSPEISVTDSPEKSKDIFKRPIDPVSLPNSKRPRLRLEEEERTREISSVMMTMSGFLSPAREGKLPEAKAPIVVSERHHDKHKTNSHHSNLMKAPLHPSLDKSEKRSKKSKTPNGKVMKSKRKDKSHKGESSKSKDSSKSDKYPPGFLSKNRDIHPTHNNHITMPAPKVGTPIPKPIVQSSLKSTPSSSKTMLPPPAPVLDTIKPIIKQEPVEHPPSPVCRNLTEDAIPVPRRIPISKSPLVSNLVPMPKQTASNSLVPDIEIKKEIIEDEEKLASQPDRSKLNIFKRISNKSKEDKNTPEVVQDKSHLNATISKLQNSTPVEGTSESRYDQVIVKDVDSVVNNNDNSALDLSKEITLTTNEVISLDDDSLDMQTMYSKPEHINPIPGSLSVKKNLHILNPKDIAGVSPKLKKEKKHREKKDKAAEKAAKLEAKLLKQQQKQLAIKMAQAQKKSLKMAKSPKLNRPKNEKFSQMPPGFPFFHNMPGRNLMPGPGLIPNPGLIPSGDFLAGLANNPALRGLAPPNLLANPFALGGAGPGLLSGPGFLSGGLGGPLPNPLMPMSNFGQPSRSSSSKFPPMLRRPSLEVIPVDNDDDRGMYKSPVINRNRPEKHKSPTIPNILQKHKSKSHKEKSNIYKMPPVQPDITIELNPPREPERQAPPTEPPPPPPPPARLPTPPPEPVREATPSPVEEPTPEASEDMDPEKSEKKKDKVHKKEKKDKDGIKIKKKKDKKDKNKDKSEKKKDTSIDKQELKELKDKIKKEKKEKKKDKTVDGLVPKLTLKLGSASPMPPSSPDVFKLNIKPIVKKEEDESPSPKEEPVSREHSRSPELAQFAALVTRPPKPKPTKNNHTSETEPKSPPPSSSSPPRKNRPPSSNKYKRILFKSLSKKAFDDNMESVSEDDPPTMPIATDKPAGPLPTPYYVDEHGNKIWVCPACGRPDNGSPMIGCDGCDGWYHWVCVGITEEPGATEDWFCTSCTAKRAAMVLAGVTASKKRGRKPKGEKVRDCN